MALTIVLAVGLDSSLVMAQGASWKSAGYHVVHADTVKEAINLFESGDFDLVLLGASVSVESSERLTYRIRSSGSLTPVVSVAEAAGHRCTFADATLSGESSQLLASIGEWMFSRAKIAAMPPVSFRNVS